jgi:hypothetical protein
MVGRSLASTILVAVFACAAPTVTTALPAAGCAACSIQGLVPSDVSAAYYSRYRYGRSRGMSPYRMNRGSRYGRGPSYGRGDMRRPSGIARGSPLEPPDRRSPTVGISRGSPLEPPDRRFGPANYRPERGGPQYGNGSSYGSRQSDGPPRSGGSQGGGGSSQSGGGSSSGGASTGGGGSATGVDRPQSTTSTATSAQEQRRFLCEKMDERQRRLIACCQPPYLQECPR